MNVAAEAFDLDALKPWIGRATNREQVADPAPVAMMSATLDRDDPAPKAGDELPPMWTWLYFLGTDPTRVLGADGLPPDGVLQPPVPLPRRMWAGGNFTFHRPIGLGTQLTQRASVADISMKTGRNGLLVFVTHRYETYDLGGLAVTENYISVFREAEKTGANAPPPAPPAKAPAEAKWRRQVEPSVPFLFRFSALTFNPHRIHYDRPYTMEQEGYPGLIVHGPLQSILMMDLVRREMPDADPLSVRFRALAPLYDEGPFSVCGAPGPDGAILWVERPDGTVTMQADVAFD
jgi:3-methylfumaryl-CoA hydratase